MGGNVGIGINNPSDKLVVNGNIKAKKLTITQTGWADYVFKPTYKLMKISSLEKYINQNGHLPDIPNEKSIMDKGNDVGETQTLLLRKIEELTLYIIKMEKEIQDLKRKKK